ncbi:hypothetical protein F5B19DRAFT_479746 [Rostrohypoxylon terebratum]|nr:hypothetical protein F5B19DRAFT_479746 [Rostrohypoxylon terebratum]
MFARRRYARISSASGISEESRKALEDSQESLPRFLFRAFGRRSGGDSRLNTPSRIIPRGFLGGKTPTDIYDIPNLKYMVDCHYRGGRIDTEFSSWAACITVACKFHVEI